MNWDALGAIAELVGAIGVVASLLYLAVQIRANTRSVRASTHQETVHGGRQVNLALAQDAEFSRIWSTGLLDFGSLSREEAIRFGSIASLFLQEFQNAMYQFDHGTLDQASLDAGLRQLEVICALPGFSEWWKRNELFRFSHKFEELVGHLVATEQGPVA